LTTHTPSLFDAALARAVELLRGGGLVALPTETVYGLAANALNAEAVAKIFKVKGRPAQNPVIVHVDGIEMAKRCVSVWTGAADNLAQAFWPGPLTLVLPRSAEIPDAVTSGGTTVGVRWPRHPFIQAVIRASGFPLATPSANLSTEVSPTTAEHVRKSLGDKIALIIDGGPAQVGIESTVLDLTEDQPRILRPGMIHAESLLAVIGVVANADWELARRSRAETDTRPAASKDSGAANAASLRSPGLLAKHYTPKAKLRILSWRNDADLRDQLSAVGGSWSAIHVIAHTGIPSDMGFGRVSVIPRQAGAFARAIYAELHRCDDEGAKLIVVEAPPDSIEWQAIVDRLQRAAA